MAKLVGKFWIKQRPPLGSASWTRRLTDSSRWCFSIPGVVLWSLLFGISREVTLSFAGLVICSRRLAAVVDALKLPGIDAFTFQSQEVSSCLKTVCSLPKVVVGTRTCINGKLYTENEDENVTDESMTFGLGCNPRVLSFLHSCNSQTAFKNELLSTLYHHGQKFHTDLCQKSSVLLLKFKVFSGVMGILFGMEAMRTSCRKHEPITFYLELCDHRTCSTLEGSSWSVVGLSSIILFM